MVEGIVFNTILVLRSADFKTRVAVHFTTDSGDSLPYRLSFYNLANGDREGDEPVELKHSTTGYIWIDGGHVVSHYTDELHEFTINTSEKEELFTVKLITPRKEEL